MHTDSDRFPASSQLVVPRRCTLHGFSLEVTSSAGIDLTTLDPLTVLLVRTRNSLYHITVRVPHRRTVWIQGGPFFPEPTRGYLNGSSFGGSCLKMAWIGIGLHLEFHAAGRHIVTSRVHSIVRKPDAAVAGPF